MWENSAELRTNSDGLWNQNLFIPIPFPILKVAVVSRILSSEINWIEPLKVAVDYLIFGQTFPR